MYRFQAQAMHAWPTVKNNTNVHVRRISELSCEDMDVSSGFLLVCSGHSQVEGTKKWMEIGRRPQLTQTRHLSLLETRMQIVRCLFCLWWAL